MENQTIAKLISIFETSTLTVAIILAIAGVVMLIMRTRSIGDTNSHAATSSNNAAPVAPQKINRIKRFTQNAFIRALCIAALVAFLPEMTYFNYQYYLRYFAGEEIAITTQDPENPQLLNLTNGGVAELFEIEVQDGRMGGIGIKFNNLNDIVTSIHIDAEHKHTDFVMLKLEWQDEEGTPYSFQKQLFKGLPHGYYIPLQPRGNVSELSLSFAVGGDVEMHINNITLNKPIPFYLSGLRLLLLTFFLFVIIIVANKETRAQLSYALFQYKFDAKNKKQTWAYVVTVFILLVLSWLSVYTTLNVREWARPQHQHYNVYLVDAIINGRTWLAYGNPEKLLEWEQPYNNHWRSENNKIVNQDWMWDWAWYKGKYYSNFGVVPAVILYVPYTLITGNYLSNHAGIFIFSAVAIVMIALLWRYCVVKWMPNARFAFFMLGFLTLYFSAAFHALFNYARYYSIVQAAGIMFATAGTYLLLKAIDKEKTNYLKLFFACLCLALIAGCRPNMVFVSILVPILLWKRRSWKLVAFVILPYIMVAIPLMWYNYVRFDSVTDFGVFYQLNSINVTSIELLNPIAKIMGTFHGVLRYLFQPAKFSLEFPYVWLVETTAYTTKYHFMPFHVSSFGFINYPIVFCLLYMFKKTFRKEALQETLPMQYGFLIACLITLFFASATLFPLARYLPDFTVFIILPSLFCAYGFCYRTKNEASEKTHTKLVYILLIISITVGALSSVHGTLASSGSGNRNPLLYQWLESVLSII